MLICADRSAEPGIAAPHRTGCHYVLARGGAYVLSVQVDRRNVVSLTTEVRPLSTRPCQRPCT